MKATKIARWVVLPDAQTPLHDKRAEALVERYIADHRWDGAIDIGDFIDFDEISHWQDRNRRVDKTGAIARSYAAAGEVMDSRLRALRASNKRARYVQIEGNHEHRITDYLDKHPESVGLLEVPIALNFEARKVEWVPYWSKGRLFRLGKATFGHGVFTVKNHAAKHLEVYGCNFYYGHLHTIQVFSQKTRGRNETKEAMCMGCLCRSDLAYLQGRPNDWQLAFAVFHILPNGNYQRFLVRIFNYRFVSPEGVLYED